MRKYEQSKRRNAFEEKFKDRLDLNKTWSEYIGGYYYHSREAEETYGIWDAAWQAAVDEIQKALKPVQRRDQLDPVEDGDENQ